MQASELLDGILLEARVKGISKARLADKAGIRPETLSRLKNRENADLKTIINLAMAAGLQLALSPLAGGESAAVYSPIENAQQKQEARSRGENMLISGAISREDLHRRSGFFSFPAAQFEIKSVKG